MHFERPRPTRRGGFVVLVAAVAVVMAYSFGGRGLNAVVMPALGLLALGAIQVGRAAAPEVTRRVPENGHVGDTISGRLTLHGRSSVALAVDETLPEGVRGAASFDAIADGRTLRYEATLTKRGVHAIGPTRTTLRDVFGLWERTVDAGGTDTVIVYPRIHALHESTGLLSGYVGLSDHREQFDSIREYEPGDALRDVNWKASAKRPGELVVTEYAGEGAHNRVTVGVRDASPNDDAAADAAASVADYLLENGLAVGVETPDETIPPGSGDEHGRRILAALARFESEPRSGSEGSAGDGRAGDRTTGDGRAGDRTAGDGRAGYGSVDDEERRDAVGTDRSRGPRSRGTRSHSYPNDGERAWTTGPRNGGRRATDDGPDILVSTDRDGTVTITVADDTRRFRDVVADREVPA